MERDSFHAWKAKINIWAFPIEINYVWIARKFKWILYHSWSGRRICIYQIRYRCSFWSIENLNFWNKFNNGSKFKYFLPLLLCCLINTKSIHSIEPTTLAYSHHLFDNNFCSINKLDKTSVKKDKTQQDIIQFNGFKIRNKRETQFPIVT